MIILQVKINTLFILHVPEYLSSTQAWRKDVQKKTKESRQANMREGRKKDTVHCFIIVPITMPLSAWSIYPIVWTPPSCGTTDQARYKSILRKQTRLHRSSYVLAYFTSSLLSTRFNLNLLGKAAAVENNICNLGTTHTHLHRIVYSWIVGYYHNSSWKFLSLFKKITLCVFHNLWRFLHGLTYLRKTLFSLFSKMIHSVI